MVECRGRKGTEKVAFTAMVQTLVLLLHQKHRIVTDLTELCGQSQ